MLYMNDGDSAETINLDLSGGLRERLERVAKGLRLTIPEVVELAITQRMPDQQKGFADMIRLRASTQKT